MSLWNFSSPPRCCSQRMLCWLPIDFGRGKKKLDPPKCLKSKMFAALGLQRWPDIEEGCKPLWLTEFHACEAMEKNNKKAKTWKKLGKLYWNTESSQAAPKCIIALSRVRNLPRSVGHKWWKEIPFSSMKSRKCSQTTADIIKGSGM